MRRFIFSAFLSATVFGLGQEWSRYSWHCDSERLKPPIMELFSVKTLLLNLVTRDRKTSNKARMEEKTVHLGAQWHMAMQLRCILRPSLYPLSLYNTSAVSYHQLEPSPCPSTSQKLCWPSLPPFHQDSQDSAPKVFLPHLFHEDRCPIDSQGR